MRWTLRSGVVVFIYLFSGWLQPAESQDPGSQPGSKGLVSTSASVAILDLFNLSNKSDYDQWESLWGRGMRRSSFTEKILTVIPYPKILEALKDLKIDDYYIAPEQVPPLAKKLNADYVVLGSFTVSNETIAASIKVVDGKTGRLLKEETRIRQADQPNEFTADLSNALLRMLVGDEQKEPTPNPTPPAETIAPEQKTAPLTTEASLPRTTEELPPPGPPPTRGEPMIPTNGEVTTVQPIGQEEPIEEAVIIGSPVPPAYPFPPAVSYQSPNPPPAVIVPQAQPQTIVRPIEAEIPSLPRNDLGQQPQTALQSPFQPLPVIPAPPPPRSAYFPPPQPSGGMMPQGGYAPQMGQGAMSPPQQPMAQPPPAQPGGPVRRFFNWVTKPFKPAEPLPPPQVAMPSQPMTNPPAMQPMAQPIPTPAPQGNVVTRFFGRLFGRG